MLKVLGMLEVGISNRRGVTMYEIHLPLAMLGHLTLATAFTQDQIDKAM